MNGIARRIELLENAAAGSQADICTACFTAEGDGFAPCSVPALHGHARRCGKYAGFQKLPDADLEVIVAARAACYGLDIETYLAQVGKDMDREEEL